MQDFFSSLYLQFLETSAMEWLATITGFICVYLAARQHILNWPVGIISVGTYLFIFYQTKLYGDAVLQIYFLITAIYGWFYWNQSSPKKEGSIVSFTAKQMLFTICAVTLLWGALGWMLANWTDSDVPYIDGFCTAMSFAAQFLMTRKVLQNWILWVIVDIAYIPLYLYKGLLLTALLYIAFAIIAWKGYRNWNKTYRSANSNEPTNAQ